MSYQNIEMIFFLCVWNYVLANVIFLYYTTYTMLAIIYLPIEQADMISELLNSNINLFVE